MYSLKKKNNILIQIIFEIGILIPCYHVKGLKRQFATHSIAKNRQSGFFPNMVK